MSGKPKQGAYTYDVVCDKFRERGCTVVSPEIDFVDLKSRLRYIAKCGHEHCLSYKVFSAGRGDLCPKCSYKIRSAKRGVTRESIIDEFSSRGCVVISGLDPFDKFRTTDKITYIPSCGHGTRSVSLGNFRAKTLLSHLCKTCSKRVHNTKIQFKEDQVEKILMEHGCKLIRGSYVNSMSPVSFIAKCGHPCSAVFSYIRRKNFSGLCKACSLDKRVSDMNDKFLEKAKKLCEKYGCRLIKYVNAFSGMLVVGKCGHEFNTTPSGLRKRDTGICPLCLMYTSEHRLFDIVKELFSEKYVKLHAKIHDTRPFQYLDVYVEKCKLAFEYNGQQHYEFTPLFHKSLDDFKKQLEKDARKRQWCKDNDVFLVEIDGRKKHYNNANKNMTKEWVCKEVERQTGRTVGSFMQETADDS